jgi:hypothetical protein
MAEAQQLRAIAPQLTGQRGRRHPLGEPAHDQDQLDGPPLGRVQGRAGEGVEDPPARLAAEVEDRGAVTAVDAQVVARPAPRAGQAAGVEPLDQLGIAGVLIHQVRDGEVHGTLRSGRGGRSPPITKDRGRSGKGLPPDAPHEPKKELIGDFDREGTIEAQGTIEVNDHDFGSMGSGTAIPHGIYDVGLNRGFVHLNTSHDTSELACDSLAAWWEDHGLWAYPGATKLLVLCDGGGSNSASRYVFKEALQELADRLGIEIRVAHYPPYCSKYNPIEHRLFPHLTRACRGVIFGTLETVRHYMAKAATSTGLEVVVRVLEKVYETGRKCAAGFKETMKIAFDKFLPKWNYRAIPEPK